MGTSRPVFYVVGAWLFVWGTVAASIVVTSTSAPASGAIDTAIRLPGSFYLDAVRTLRQFALLTTIPARWTDVGYAALSIVPLSIHIVLTGFGVQNAAEQYDEDWDLGINVIVIGVAPSLLAVIGAAVFYLGAQLLTVSLVGVAVGLLTLLFSNVVAA